MGAETLFLGFVLLGVFAVGFAFTTTLVLAEIFSVGFVFLLLRRGNFSRVVLARVRWGVEAGSVSDGRGRLARDLGGLSGSTFAASLLRLRVRAEAGSVTGESLIFGRALSTAKRGEKARQSLKATSLTANFVDKLQVGKYRFALSDKSYAYIATDGAQCLCFEGIPRKFGGSGHDGSGQDNLDSDEEDT